MLAATRSVLSRAARAPVRAASTVARAAAAASGSESFGNKSWAKSLMFGAVAAAAVGSVAACEEEEENPELASMAIFSGNANPDLAALIAQHVGKPLGSATVGRFPDGEVSVSVHENGENGPLGRLVVPLHTPVERFGLLRLVLLAEAGWPHFAAARANAARG